MTFAPRRDTHRLQNDAVGGDERVLRTRDWFV